MAVKTIDDAILTDIADAIREKMETSDTYYPHSMAQAIRQIETGGVLTEVTVTPSGSVQIINPEEPNTGFSKVIVQKIPSNYGRIDWNGNRLKVY